MGTVALSTFGEGFTPSHAECGQLQLIDQRLQCLVSLKCNSFMGVLGVLNSVFPYISESCYISALERSKLNILLSLKLSVVCADAGGGV